ncbi:MAG TPA: hypothetical protein VH163_04840 [Gemmatimonadales bacterium]|jgi:hypothetical protein|nr:hypothetical protein [Gemmatimonadales bacterium]
MKRTVMLCLTLLAGGAISAKAQTRVIVSFGVGTPGYAGFVSVGQPWYWYGGERVYYVRRSYEGRPMWFYDPRYVPEDWRGHDRNWFERHRDWDRGRKFDDRDGDREWHDRGQHRGWYKRDQGDQGNHGDQGKRGDQGKHGDHDRHR